LYKNNLYVLIYYSEYAKCTNILTFLKYRIHPSRFDINAENNQSFQLKIYGIYIAFISRTYMYIVAIYHTNPKKLKIFIQQNHTAATGLLINGVKKQTNET